MAASVAMAVLVAAALASDVTETWAEYKARMDHQVKRKGKSPTKITAGKEFCYITRDVICKLKCMVYILIKLIKYTVHQCNHVPFFALLTANV